MKKSTVTPVKAQKLPSSYKIKFSKRSIRARQVSFRRKMQVSSTQKPKRKSSGNSSMRGNSVNLTTSEKSMSSKYGGTSVGQTKRTNNSRYSYLDNKYARQICMSCGYGIKRRGTVSRSRSKRKKSRDSG